MPLGVAIGLPDSIVAGMPCHSLIPRARVVIAARVLAVRIWRAHIATLNRVDKARQAHHEQQEGTLYQI